jgi:hypothetical protein
MDAEEFKKAIDPLLKQYGFRRSNATWRRNQVESIAVLNVQKSQWDGGVFYINLGSYFFSLGSERSPTENKCQVRVRLEISDPGSVVAQAIHWFDARATLKAAALLADEDSKKGLVFKEVRNAVHT